MLGIIYPLMYWLSVRSDYTNRISNLLLLNKYWIMFGLLTLFESVFGFVLNLIPGYYYLKFVMIYLLMRNNFALSDFGFIVMESYVSSLKIPTRIGRAYTRATRRLHSIYFDPPAAETAEALVLAAVPDNNEKSD